MALQRSQWNGIEQREGSRGIERTTGTERNAWCVLSSSERQVQGKENEALRSQENKGQAAQVERKEREPNERRIETERQQPNTRGVNESDRRQQQQRSAMPGTERTTAAKKGGIEREPKRQVEQRIEGREPKRQVED